MSTTVPTVTNTIREFMTPSPHCISSEQTLATAHRLMREYRVRHLPVLHGGQILGVLSDRDLALVETLRGVNPNEVPVSEAMTPDPYTVAPEASLGEVVATMAEHRYGSAIVAHHGKVVGVFTTVDALQALSHMLGSKPGRADE